MYKYLDMLILILIVVLFSEEFRLIALSFNRLRRRPLEAKFQDRTLVGQLIINLYDWNLLYYKHGGNYEFGSRWHDLIRINNIIL